MSFNYANGRKQPQKQLGRLASLFGNVPSQRLQTEASGKRKNYGSASKINTSDLMPQGMGLKTKFSDNKNLDLKRLNAAAENDERYKYLLKNGIIRKVEDDDKIIYAELPQIPGVLVVYRKPSERNANPERLNLDKRELDHLPLLEGEERLRLLNFQHNNICKISNLVSLPNLIFLDLYNNKIREINNLNTVPTLRVLMLGKNQIDKIKNLTFLVKLDVLDLHSNKITQIEGLNFLKELRVLNLANNQLSLVENISDLVSLNEINLRKNAIETLCDLDLLQKLTRVFLSNNKIARFEDLQCLQSWDSLNELTLDGNPIQSHLDYLSWILNSWPSVKNLDLKKVTNDMRTTCALIIPEETKTEEIQEPQQPKEVESPKLMPDPVVNFTKEKESMDSKAEEIMTTIEEEWCKEINRLKNGQQKRRDRLQDWLVQSAHAVIEAETTLIAAGNAFEVFGDSEFYAKVTSMQLKFMRFEFLIQSSNFQLFKNFKSLGHLTLETNNISSLVHLSKLEQLASLRSLKLLNNDINHIVYFRSYIVYRFPNVREINDRQVNEEDRNAAKQQFQGFDKTLSVPTVFNRSETGRKASIVNIDAATWFVEKLICQPVVATSGKIDAIGQFWDYFVYSVIKDMGNEQEISETELLSLLNAPSIPPRSS